MSQEQINISHMQCWLFRMAQTEWNKSAEETAALFMFSTSSTYRVLFDFETGAWKEGPDYLRSLFERALPQ